MHDLKVGDIVRSNKINNDSRLTITHIDIDQENAVCWADDNKAYVIPLVILERDDH